LKGVYLPDGLWVDYWAGSLHEGGTIVVVEAPLDRLPLFVRAGAIIPMQQVMDYVGEEPADTLMLDVFPTFAGITETFTLYEDDEQSLDYQQGEYAKIPLTQILADNGRDATLGLTVGAAQGSFPEMLASRTVIATIRLVEDAPGPVSLNSDTLDSYSSKAELLLAGDGYFYDDQANLLLIKFEHDVTMTSGISIEEIHLPAGIYEPDPEPGTVLLRQNYPNPFTEETSIKISLGSAERVKLEVFNLLGQKVVTLLDEDRLPGRHIIPWDGTTASGETCAPGIYLYRLTAGEVSQTKKMMLVR
jgi:hypothetical protein